MNIETLIITVILGVLTLTIFAAFLVLLRRINPTLDTWWDIFLAWVIGIILAAGLGVNIVAPWVAIAAVGYALTGMTLGGMALVIRGAVS